MAERHFEANPTIRNLTAVVAYANASALLASVMFAGFGRPAGLVLAPLWLWGSIEAGRAAWSNHVTVTLTSQVLLIERSNHTTSVELAHVSWFGLTRRGVVIESIASRFCLFDQDWKASTAVARELESAVGTRQRLDGVKPQPATVSHDKVRQLTNLGLLVLVAMGTGLVSVAAVVGQLSATERATSLVTAAPICLWTATQAIRLARRPVLATFLARDEEDSVNFKRLYGSSISVTTPSVRAAPSTTVTQRLTGAPPGEAVFVGSPSINWTGPIAAPKSFDGLVDLYGHT